MHVALPPSPLLCSPPPPHFVEFDDDSLLWRGKKTRERRGVWRPFPLFFPYSRRNRMTIA